VSTRVRALEKLGVLQGFVPLISVQRLAALGRSPNCVAVYIVPRQHSPRDVEKVAQSVAREPTVCYLFQMAGSHELMALASTVSTRATERLLATLSGIPGVARVRPVSIARVHKERPRHPVGRPEPNRLPALIGT
jgi:DNA-binding Lrp family transcriptional regulator